MLKTDKSPICGFEFGFDASGSLGTVAAAADETELADICGAKYPGLWYGVVSGCHHDGVVVLPNGRRVVGRGFGFGVVVVWVGRLCTDELILKTE